MPVVTVFYDPEVLYMRAQSPHRTLAEAIESAKKNPGKARWGAANPASLERIAMERLNRVTQARAIVVSYEGGRDQMLNVLNGTLDLGIGEIQEMVSQIEAGQVRLLATLTGEPACPACPALPTAKEQGVDVVVTKFRGLAGPKNLPPERAQGLERRDQGGARRSRVPEGVPARGPRAGVHGARRSRQRSPRASRATSAASLRELGVIK